LKVSLPVPYDEAVARATERAQGARLWRLDDNRRQATLKAKLDRDFRKYVILGACNPALRIARCTPNWKSGCFYRAT
jgi:uncharacterized protein (DUF302 family)